MWYPEPRCASMGKRPTSVPVADVSKAVHDRQFPQQQIITQIQNFRDKFTMMNHQLTDLQHSLADLAILSARQEQFQKTCLEELRSLNTQPPTLPQPTQGPLSPLVLRPSLLFLPVDAFTGSAFKGNPAAVCMLEEDRDDQWLQVLAAEFNLSEDMLLDLAY